LKNRFGVIETYILYRGYVQRADLSRHFDIGTVTATRALQAYTEKYPTNMVYSPSKKAYVHHVDFEASVPISPEFALELLAYGTYTSPLDLQTCGPSITKNLSPKLNRSIVAAITRAIYARNGIEVKYISASSGEKHRTLYPHSIFKAGSAWYFRAFDTKNSTFRTFRFNRTVEITSSGVTPHNDAQRQNDNDWLSEVSLSLSPHPNHPNRAALATDLGLETFSVKNLRVNKVIAPFILQDYRVDCSKDGSMDPQSFFLRLMNVKEFEGDDFLSWAPGKNI
jgi:hypothetical protein